MVTKLCLVGAGSIGRRHLRLLAEREDVALCVVELNEQCKAAVSQEFPQMPFFDSMEAAITDGGCEAVIIATPHRTHAPLAIKALELGAHVFVEKPMSDSLEDCVALLNTAKQSDKIVSVGFMFRFDPFVQKVKEIIDSGRIGKILHYSSRFATYNTLRCSVTRHQEHTPYSLVMDCIHDSDLIYHFTGRIPDYAYSVAYKAGDLPLSSPQNFIDTVYRYEDKSMGAHIHFNYVQHPQIHDLQIVGDKGYILGDFMSADVTVGDRETMDTEVFPSTRSNINNDFNNVYRTEWNEFLRAIRGERKPENPPEQAIVSTLLMHAQIASAESGKKVDIRALAAEHGYQY
jgi:predicted dehydrogenase